MFRRLSDTHAGGFTLVEVLVALVVAAIGLQLAFEMFSTHARLLDDGTHERRAVSLAESMLARVGTEAPLRPGVSEGRFDGAYHWRLAVAARQRGDQDSVHIVVPYDVELVVTWSGWLRERAARLHTLKLGPASPASQ